MLGEEDSLPLHQATVGDAVEIKNLGTTGILLESVEEKTRVNIRIGEKVLSVDTELLRGIRQSHLSEPGSTSSKPPRSKKGTSISTYTTHQTQDSGSMPSLTIDLRGKAVDEAIEATEAAFDQAILQGKICIQVIHGHGTGKLKSSLRTYFSVSPYVTAFRPGERSEGGDGVTVVELR